MDLAIIIIVSISLALNLLVGIFLVRFRENTENTIKKLQLQVDRLTKELVLRLPPRPYGVEAEDEVPILTPGPMDWRQ